MPSITFAVRYPGAAASSNHGYAPRKWTDATGQERVGLRMVPEARDFKAEVLVLARQVFGQSEWMPRPREALRITLQGRFPSRRHADVHNLAKYIMDAIQEALDGYIDSGPLYNDSCWGVTCEPPQYEKGCEPTIEVTVEGA